MKNVSMLASLCFRGIKESFLHRIVTCNGKWILYNNRKRLASWLDKDETPKHSPKPNIHQNKLMVTAWWNSHSLIYYSFIEPGQSIAVGTYCKQLDNMIKNRGEKQLRLVNRDRLIFLHDNARPHTASRM